jgi:hypothetical protein
MERLSNVKETSSKTSVQHTHEDLAKKLQVKCLVGVSAYHISQLRTSLQLNVSDMDKHKMLYL